MPLFRIALFWLCLVYATPMAGQKNIAIIEDGRITSPVVKNIQDSLYGRLSQLSGVNHLVYAYEGDSLRFDLMRNPARTEVSPDVLMLVSINLYESDEPALNMVRY